MRKPVIAMDLSSTGMGGGPYTSTSRTMNSNLKHKYDFKVIRFEISSKGLFFLVKFDSLLFLL